MMNNPEKTKKLFEYEKNMGISPDINSGVDFQNIEVDVPYISKPSEDDDKKGKIEKRRKQVARLYQEGKSQRKIAEELQVTERIVRFDIERLSKAGVIKKGKRKKEIEERRKQVARLYQEGKTQKEIAEELQVTPRVVYFDEKKLFSDGIIQKRKRIGENPRIKERRKQVARLYQEGKSQKEIAEELQVTTNVVYLDLKKLLSDGIIKKGTMKTDAEKRHENIQKRRKQVARLYQEGKSQREIAEELQVTTNVVYLDLKKLLSDGIIQKRKRKRIGENPRIKERRKQVAKLYNKGKRTEEIAKKVQVSVSTVLSDIKQLLNDGIIEKRNRIEKNPRIKERRKQVARLYREGKTQKEIAEELQVSVSTVLSDIKQLLNDGIIEKRNRTEENSRIKERRKQVARLYNEGKRKKEIAQELQVSIDTVNVDIQELIKNGIVQELKKGNAKKVEERRKEVARLYNEGKSRREIVQELQVSVGTVTMDIQKLIKNGIIQKRTDVKRNAKKKEERRKKVARLYNEGKSRKEIAEELQISVATVGVYIQELIKNGAVQDLSKEKSEKKEERRKQVARLYQEGKTQKEIAEELQVSLSVVYNDEKRLLGDGISRSIQERRKKVARLYREGNSIEEIAQKLQISEIEIYKDIRALLKVGIIEDENRINEKERKKQVLNLWETGGILSEISEKLGVDISVVMEELISSGLSKSSIEEENGKRIELRIKKFKEEANRNREEKRKCREKEQEMEIYKNAMIRSIRLYYKKGDFERVREYIEELQNEVLFSDKERKELDTIMESLEELISRKSKLKENIPPENIEIDDGEER